MAEVEDIAVVVAAIQREDMDAEIRVHVIIFTVMETIIHQISVGTSLINLNGLKLLILHLLQLLSSLLKLLLLLCKSPSQTMNVFFSYKQLKHPNQLILSCMSLF